MNVRKVSEQTRAVMLAADDVDRVIESFRTDPPFMQEARSRRVRRRRDVIANAPPDIRALIGRFPLEFIERLARAEVEGGA